MRTRIFMLLLTLIAFIGVSAGEQIPAIEEEIELGGWLVSGKRVGFSALDLSKRQTPPGELVTFCPTRRIQDLLVHGDTLWIGTEGGLFAYSLSEDSLALVEGPVAGSISTIAIDDEGAIWAGGRNGLSIRSGAGWKHYTRRANRFFSMVTDVVAVSIAPWVPVPPETA